MKAPVSGRGTPHLGEFTRGELHLCVLHRLGYHLQKATIPLPDSQDWADSYKPIYRISGIRYITLFSSKPKFVQISVIEGSLEVKLPTIWTDEKQSRAEAERRERLEERRSEKRKSQKKEDADARKGRKVAKHCVFPMIWGSGGSKSRLAKAAGAEPAGQMRDEKVHAVVARSTFASQNVQNTTGPDNFWKLRCRKSARRCGAKHISKSKCTKHLSSGPLLEVEMSKKCTPLWREAHFEVKMYKTLGVRTTFQGSDVASLRFGSLHYTIHSTTLQYITLHYTPQHYNYRTTQLHSTTLHYII